MKQKKINRQKGFCIILLHNNNKPWNESDELYKKKLSSLQNVIKKQDNVRVIQLYGFIILISILQNFFTHIKNIKKHTTTQ